MKSFLQKCLDGEANINELGAIVSEWYHTYNRYDKRDLHEYIGLTWDEYIKWSKGDSQVPYKKFRSLLALKKLAHG